MRRAVVAAIVCAACQGKPAAPPPGAANGQLAQARDAATADAASAGAASAGAASAGAATGSGVPSPGSDGAAPEGSAATGDGELRARGEEPEVPDPSRVIAELGAIPAWQAVIDRAQLLGRRGQHGVVYGRVGPPVMVPAPPGTLPSPTAPGAADAGTPASGVPAPGVPASGAPAPGVSASGAPTGATTSGAPAPGVPASGAPAPGVSASGAPAGATTSGAPAPGVPASGAPAPSATTSGAPAPGAPAAAGAAGAGAVPVAPAAGRSAVAAPGAQVGSGPPPSAAAPGAAAAAPAIRTAGAPPATAGATNRLASGAVAAPRPGAPIEPVLVASPYVWLIDDTEGNGALGIRIALGDKAREGDRIAAGGAWQLDADRRWFWKADAVQPLPPAPPSELKDPPALLPNHVIATAPLPAGARMVSLARDNDLIYFQIVGAPPVTDGDGWLVADELGSPIALVLNLPGERPTYGGQDMRAADERWQLRRGQTYWLRIGRLRKHGDKPASANARTAPVRLP